jgi:hypothetical protein
MTSTVEPPGMPQLKHHAVWRVDGDVGTAGEVRGAYIVALRSQDAKARSLWTVTFAFRQDAHELPPGRLVYTTRKASSQAAPTSSVIWQSPRAPGNSPHRAVSATSRHRPS